MSCKFWKILLCVVVVGAVFLLIAFSSTFWKKEKIEAVPEWHTNVMKNIYVVLFGLSVSEEDRWDYLVNNPEHKLPVLDLYIEPVSLTVNQEWLPKIFVVIWEDGTIVWGASKEDVSTAQEMANNEQEIKYLMSRIDRDKVKELLFAVADSSVWNANFYVFVGERHTYLTIRNEEKEYTMAVNDVDGPTLYEVFQWDGISGIKSAMEWTALSKNFSKLVFTRSRLLVYRIV